MFPRNRITRWVSQHVNVIFPLLAFAIPLAIRCIPEVLMGPYPVGFDTIGYYVPNTLTWLHTGLNVGSLLAEAPFFYFIYMPLVAMGGSAVYILKVMAPLLLGFLGLAMYMYAKKGLVWSVSKSMFVAVLGTIYFVALRTSWDQFRVELGLIFFFIALTFMAPTLKGKSWKHYSVLSLTMLAVVLSNQLVAVIMFAVVIVSVLYNLRKDIKQSINLTAVVLPSVLYFFVVYLTGLIQSNIIGYSNDVSPLTGFTSYQSMLLNAGGFFLFSFLPILPLVVVGLWRSSNLQLKSWLIVSLVLVFLPLSFVNPYRWILLLVYPFCFFTVEAISRLKSTKPTRFKQSIRKIAVLYLILSTVILSIGFIFTTPEAPFPYFSSGVFMYEVPTSMQQNTISVADCHDTAITLQWFKDNMNGSALLLTHTVFYGWASLVINNTQLWNYRFGDPTHEAMAAAQEGHMQIYTIWWVSGKGWAGLSSLPPSFHEVYHSGNIALYSYNPVANG